MFNFLELIICIMALFFPLMIYSYYILYKKNFKEKEKPVILNLTLFLTLFLIINILIQYNNNIYYIFCTIPLLLSYIYKNKTMIIIISIIVSIYIYVIFDINILLILLLNCLYILSYFYYITSNKKVTFLTRTFLVETLIILLLGLVAKFGTEIISVKLLVIAALYILVILLLEYCHKKTHEIVNIYMTLREVKKEKQIKTSLFKITHEIKNPLAVVSGYLQMYDAEDVEKSKRYIKIIESEIKRTLNLLDDFNEFTKIKVNKEKTDFNNLLDSIKKTIIPIAKKSNVICDFQTEENIIVEIDEDRMKQVIINLVKNAIEASYENGIVEIISYKDDKNFYLDIKDHGTGMSKEVMDNLLKPFYTTKKNGTGLGVSLSNEIIIAHGGELEYSSLLNDGSVFKIILPL